MIVKFPPATKVKVKPRPYWCFMCNVTHLYGSRHFLRGGVLSIIPKTPEPPQFIAEREALLNEWREYVSKG